MSSLKVTPYKGYNPRVFCSLCGYQEGKLVFELHCDFPPDQLDMLQKSLRGGFTYPLFRQVTNLGVCYMVHNNGYLEVCFKPIEGNEGVPLCLKVKKEEAWKPIKHCLELSLKSFNKRFG